VLQWRSLRGTELNSAFQSGIAAEPLKRTGMRDVVFGLLARRYRAGQDESREADRWGRSAVATFGWSFASEDFRRGAADDLFLVEHPASPWQRPQAVPRAPRPLGSGDRHDAAIHSVAAMFLGGIRLDT
jgi:hypothetical protein